MKKCIPFFLLICSLQPSLIVQAQNTPSSRDTTFTQSFADSLEAEPLSPQKASSKLLFINALPKDLANSTLVVLLFEESTEYFKNKNVKYQERFKEYPYPILFVQPAALETAIANNKYMLVDLYRKSIEQRFRGKAGGGFELDTKHIIYHNYCIKDNRNPDTYYRLIKWIDCEKGGEIFCLKRFIKGVINANED
ncbi:MAG: hypothetical protein K0R51_1451 [Cytophagaceae bacterium]|jgi:hypothetical protein|nr:hypothetical protein [Cytophagaceae bacterium]